MSRDATTPFAFASARSDTTTPSQSLGQSLRSFGEQLLLHEDGSSCKQDSSRVTPQKSPIWAPADIIEGAGSSTKVGGTNGEAGPKVSTAAVATTKDSFTPTLSLLREQLTQSTIESKRLQRGLDEKTAEARKYQRELEHMKAELSQERITSKEVQRALADLQARLREKEGQVNALEAKHADTVAIMSQQIATVRESRDEEIQCLLVETKESIAALTKEHEAALNKARAVEIELRQGTQRLREENQQLRSVAQKAEGRMAEAELASARAISKFESAVSTIRQLEDQYEHLSRDAAAAEQLRSDRINQLEEEVEGLRVSHAAEMTEKEASFRQAIESLRNTEAKFRQTEASHQEAELIAAQHATAATKLRQELAQVTEKYRTIETELEGWRQQALIAQADLQRQRGAYEGAQSLLEATKLALESAQSEAERFQQKLEKIEEQRKEEVASALKLLEDVKRSKEEEFNALKDQMETDTRVKEEAWAEERQALVRRIQELEVVNDAQQNNEANTQGNTAMAMENEELRSQLAQLKLSLVDAIPADGVVAVVSNCSNEMPAKMESLPDKEDALTKARRQVLLAKEYLRTFSGEGEGFEG